ncbi:hypothetical protein Mal64_18820 [Pseudobythopirellula maris]|uniref:Uncharacterized protein n=1 Tax=Pseudobythopirellula maris TaxID=2527991 RepID=A0A5C5ZNP5_9BACT|nr:hypothetical protein [Pseudobythopirellula maris]TWT88401.1 hypothetical protein Mal64_18820 [Pseudobythopirellula maris]
MRSTLPRLALLVLIATTAVASAGAQTTPGWIGLSPAEPREPAPLASRRAHRLQSHAMTEPQPYPSPESTTPAELTPAPYAGVVNHAHAPAFRWGYFGAERHAPSVHWHRDYNDDIVRWSTRPRY